MRRDAQRNRARLVEAALKLLLDTGHEPPLDAVAKAAGVGIGTVYRHFAGRVELLDAVGHLVLDRAVAEAEAALADGAEGADGHASLRQYLHGAVRGGVGALNLIHPLLDDPTWTARRDTIAPLLAAILERGKRDGSLRGDVDAADLVHAVIRHSRRVELGLPPDQERAIAHRHLDLFVDGLRSAPGKEGT